MLHLSTENSQSNNNLSNFTPFTAVDVTPLTPYTPLGSGQSVQQLAFIDSAVEDYPLLVEDLLTTGTLVFVLDPTRDGITQITDTLNAYIDISGLHIISHGSAGHLQLGNSVVNSQDLSLRQQDLKTWEIWQNTLTPDADILLYGCDVANGEQGTQFVTALAQLTGADIAASTDSTGNADLSGNWVLEYETGEIQSAPFMVDAYGGLLASFNFGNFASTSGLQLNGNATQVGTALQLTPAVAYQTGSTFNTTPIEINADTSFQTQFQFRLTGGSGGADGFAFVLQNSEAGANALGSGGGNFGLLSGPSLGSTQIPRSLAIEFDTYRNSWDPNNNHIAVLRDGDVTQALATTSAGLPDLNSGSLLNAWVEYDGSTNRLEVFLSPQTTRPNTATLSYTVDLAAVLGSQAYVGFSGTTGGLVNAQQITSWTFNSDETSPTSSPGTPPTDGPIRIEAEDYVTAQDSTPTNLGGAYRAGAVDIEATTDVGGGFNVGWTAPGEYLTYNLTIPTSGTYNLVARVASDADGPHSLGFSVAGQSGTLNFAGTGDWQNWTDVTAAGLTLAAGTYTLGLDIASGTEFNINYIDVIPVTPTAPTPGITLSQTDGTTTVTEGSETDTYSLILNAAPTADVVVTLANGNGQTTTDVTSLTFTPTDWNVPQTVTVTAVDDTLVEGSHNGTITHTVTSADPQYNGLAAAPTPLTVVITDNDAPPPTDGPIRIEAEDYVTAQDSTPTNLGEAYRTGTVDIEATTDVGGGFNVGWTAPGEYLTYTLTIPTGGTYNLVARVASDADGPHSLGFSVAGQSGTLNFTGTGDWQNWTDVTAAGLTLAAGTYTLRLDIASGTEFNINYIDVIPVDDVIALKDNATILVNEATGLATVTVVRTGSTQERVTLEYTTNELGEDGSAQAGADYTPPTFAGRANTGQVVFEIGEAEKSFTIPITNDLASEGNETFAVGIQNPSAGTLGAPRTVLITILDDDTSSTLALSEATLTVSEDATTVNLTVQRSGNTSGAASVAYATSNGTAIAGSDYTATAGTVTFAPGQITQTLAIPILNDPTVESNETFSVTLSNPTGAVLGSPETSTSTITILDNDLALGTLTRQTVVTGLNQPIALDWTPDGRYMLVAQKNGIVRVVDNGVLRSTPLIDLSSQVNDTRDRGLLGLAVHPDFPNNPYVYLSYTYDPDEVYDDLFPGTNLDGPDQNGNRPSRLVRVRVNPTTMVADPASLDVLLGKNSTWEYTSRPDGNSTGATSILPSGIVNGTTITARPTRSTPAPRITILIVLGFRTKMFAII
jgi:hypothetical protein